MDTKCTYPDDVYKKRRKIDMSPEKSQDLVKIYPELFIDAHELMPIYMFGFECGDGWFEILKECISKIKEICLSKGLDLMATQVKEKYGTLRFYLNNYTDEINSVIEEAEKKSKYTCEDCGNQGSTRLKGSWCLTRCDNCFN